MTKRIPFLISLLLLAFFSVAMAAEELRLRAVLPSSSVLRGTKGAVGLNYQNRNRLPDSAIEDGHLYAEGGIDIGTFYAGSSPGHSAYINSHTLGHDLRVSAWGTGYADGTMSGVVGSMAIGTDTIHSFEKLYIAVTQNLRWVGSGASTHVRRVTDGPGSFMLLGKTWGVGDLPGLFFQIAPVGTAGSYADQRCETLRNLQSRTELWTYANGTFNKGTGRGLWVDGVRVDVASDINLKKDITNMPTVLDRIDTIRGVQFKWKDNSDNFTHAGVIAQEVERSFPELVHANPAGIKYVSYQGLTGVLVEAVKELKKQDEELILQDDSMENTAEELKEEGRSLETRISRLEKKNQDIGF